jgi:hypothetical protein
MGWGVVDWIVPAQDRVKWRPLVNTGIIFLVPSYVWNPQELLVFQEGYRPVESVVFTKFKVKESTLCGSITLSCNFSVIADRNIAFVNMLPISG